MSIHGKHSEATITFGVRCEPIQEAKEVLVSTKDDEGKKEPQPLFSNVNDEKPYKR